MGADDLEGAAVLNGLDGPVEFDLPNINTNEDGWGPNIEEEEEQDFIRFAPYSRSDKIGRVADWTISSDYQGNSGGEGYRRGGDFGGRGGRHAANNQYYVSGIDSAFNFGDGRDEDATFNLVDRSSSQKKPNYRRNRFTKPTNFGNRGRYNYNYNRNNLQMGGNVQQQVRRDDRRIGGNHRRRNAWNEKVTKQKECSINVDPRWVELEEFTFDNIRELHFQLTEPPVDLYISGSVYCYDNKYEKANPRKDAIELKAPDAPEPLDPTIRDDMYIQSISANYPDNFVIFTSDKVLSLLMCSVLSVQPWDLIIERVGNILYLDKRVNGPVDEVIVNETSPVAPQIENQDITTPNSPAFLSAEATFCARVLQYLVQDKEKPLLRISGPAIFKVHNEQQNLNKLSGVDASKNQSTTQIQDNASENALTFIANPGNCYRYRKWSLGQGILLICRFKIDILKDSSLPAESEGPFDSSNISSISQKLRFFNLRILNECDPKAFPPAASVESWIKGLQSNVGSVLAKEIKNNQNRFNRWLVESIFAGVDTIKLAFISRLNPKIYTKPLLLYMHTLTPENISESFGLSRQKFYWGVIKAFADYFKDNLSDGTHVLVRDSNKPALKIYRCVSKKVTREEEDADINITVRDDDAL